MMHASREEKSLFFSASREKNWENWVRRRKLADDTCCFNVFANLVTFEREFHLFLYVKWTWATFWYFGSILMFYIWQIKWKIELFLLSDKMNNKLSRSVVIVEFWVRTLQSGEIIPEKDFSWVTRIRPDCKQKKNEIYQKTAINSLLKEISNWKYPTTIV